MRQKFVFATAVAVCLSLALIPAFAAERVVDRNGDRGKAVKARSAQGTDVQFSELTRHLPNGMRASTTNNSAVADKAASILSAAAKLRSQEAMNSLQQVISMDLQSSDRADKILSTAYEMIGNLYEGTPAKQVRSYAMALQYASDPGMRNRLENQIRDLGGDLFAIQAQLNARDTTTYDMRDPGPDDSCAGAIAVTLPHSEVMSITPPGDANWRSFDITGTVEPLVSRRFRRPRSSTTTPT
jgi:hypothetical protein